MQNLADSCYLAPIFNPFHKTFCIPEHFLCFILPDQPVFLFGCILKGYYSSCLFQFGFNFGSFKRKTVQQFYGLHVICSTGLNCMNLTQIASHALITACMESTADEFQSSFSRSFLAPSRNSLTLLRYIFSDPTFAGFVERPFTIQIPRV